jgi:hypothetical protein
VIVGIFLILFGICITLVGGGCTLMILSFSTSMYQDGSWMLLLLSLAIFGGGPDSHLGSASSCLTGGFKIPETGQCPFPTQAIGSDSD